MTSAYQVAAGAGRARRAAWVAAVIIAGFFIPAGGFLVVAISRIQRFKPSSPELPLMLAVATVALVMQLVGMAALGGTDYGVSPATRVG